MPGKTVKASGIFGIADGWQVSRFMNLGKGMCAFHRGDLSRDRTNNRGMKDHDTFSTGNFKRLCR